MKNIKSSKCKQCGKEFTKYKSTDKFCSAKCQNKSVVIKEKEKRQKVREKKKVSATALKLKLDLVFGRYIRLRDCIATTGTTTYGVCITSNERIPFERGDCGHFQSRRHLNTRWDERNCHFQSKADNNWGAGEQYKHGKAINLLYGEGTADELVRLSGIMFKPTTEWYQEKIAYYSEKVKEMEEM